MAISLEFTIVEQKFSSARDSAGPFGLQALWKVSARTRMPTFAMLKTPYSNTARCYGEHLLLLYLRPSTNMSNRIVAFVHLWARVRQRWVLARYRHAASIQMLNFSLSSRRRALPSYDVSGVNHELGAIGCFQRCCGLNFTEAYEEKRQRVFVVIPRVLCLRSCVWCVCIH